MGIDASAFTRFVTTFLFFALSLTKNKVFSIAPAVIMFSQSRKPTGIVIAIVHYLKHPAGWKTVRNLVS